MIDNHQDDCSCPENSASDHSSASSAIRDKPDPFAARFQVRARLILCRAYPDLHLYPAIPFPDVAFRHARTLARYFPAARFPNAAMDRERTESLSTFSVLRWAAEFESVFAARRSRYSSRRNLHL